VRACQGDFMDLLPPSVAQPIERTPVGYGDEPGPERTVGIVGLADGVDGQRNVLNRVLYFARVAEEPGGAESYVRSYFS